MASNEASRSEDARRVWVQAQALYENACTDPDVPLTDVMWVQGVALDALKEYLLCIEAGLFNGVRPRFLRVLLIAYRVRVLLAIAGNVERACARIWARHS